MLDTWILQYDRIHCGFGSIESRPLSGLPNAFRNDEFRIRRHVSAGGIAGSPITRTPARPSQSLTP